MVITAERSSLIGRFSVLVGTAVIVSACGGGDSSSNESDRSPAATPISASDQLVLQVQPIQVCDDAGIVCAQVEFFETIADKIWDQANIDIAFLPLNQLNDSTYLTTDADEFSDLSFSGDAGDFGRHPDSSRTEGPINLWFVDVIETSTGLIQFGNAWIGLNGVLISDDLLDFNGTERIDVIAHELGHNLGLRHTTFGAGPDDNLMSSGGVRTVPESIDDIFPDGDRLSQLTSAQIERARDSDFLTGTSGDSAPLPITEADAVLAESSPANLSNTEADVILAESFPANLPNDAVPQLLSSTPTSVPEGSPSWLTWLLLMFLGQRVYSRINR
ncbi:MAG: zinc-dependent metalloprotease family protein [Leptolyngbyaceae cyanobacterium]